MFNYYLIKNKFSLETIFDVAQMPSPLFGNHNIYRQDKFKAIRHELDSGCGAVTFNAPHLLDTADNERNQGFIHLGQQLGSLQTHKKGNPPILRVEPKTSNNPTKPSSESLGIVPFHTDDCYCPNPIKYLILLAIKPARVGGENQVLSIAKRLSEFKNSFGGAEAVNVLKRETFPFSMPPKFHTDAEQQTLPLACGPIILDNGVTRFQIKALREGFRRRPDLATDEKVMAVELFNNYLQRHLEGQGVRLERGTVLIINNWRAMHSRKTFDDPERLLLRLSVAGHFPQA